MTQTTGRMRVDMLSRCWLALDGVEWISKERNTSKGYKGQTSEQKKSKWPSQRWSFLGGLPLRPGRPFTGVSGPSRPGIPKKSQKECFWGSAKKVPAKKPKKVEKYPKKSNFGYFLTFSGTFETFLGFRARRLLWMAARVASLPTQVKIL